MVFGDIEVCNTEIEQLTHDMAEATALTGSKKSTLDECLAVAEDGNPAAEEALIILKNYCERCWKSCFFSTEGRVSY